MTKLVLFISIDGMTDMLGQAQVLPYLTGLSSQGYKICIACCEKKKNFLKNKDAVSSIVTKYNIEWNYCFYNTAVPFISQIQNFFNLKKLARQYIVKNKEDIILHCRSYLPALIGLQLKQKFKTRFIFDMRGFWADERIDGNIWSIKNPLHKLSYDFFKRKEIEMIESADFVVTLTNSAKKEILSWRLKTTPKIEVIPCCADLNHFTIQSQEEKKTTRTELNIQENNFVIGYLGSLGTWYMLNEMLDFFVELQKKRPNSLFFFITNDPEEEILKVAKTKHILPSAILVKSAKRNEVPAYISCLDAGLFFIKPLYSKKGSSPTKLAELLACGVPIITNKGVGDVDELLPNTNSGILVSSFTKGGYESAIAKIDSLDLPKQTFRDIALANFSLQMGVSAYEEIYRYVLFEK